MSVSHGAGILLLLGVFVCSVAAADPPCGQQYNSSSNFIINGKNSVPGEWPWQVGLVYLNRTICGGSILDNSTVLTAAHCVDRSRWRFRWMYVLSGATNITNTTGTQKNYIRTVHIHPQYRSGFLRYDIALVKLRTPLTWSSRVAPVCLQPPYAPEQPGDSMWVTGWGAVQQNPSTKYAQVLQKVEKFLISDADCNSRIGNLGTIAPGMICAATNDGKDACKGDSGSPMVSKRQGTWYQVGLVSWGPPLCGAPNTAGVYTQMSYYFNWIHYMRSAALRNINHH